MVPFDGQTIEDDPCPVVHPPDSKRRHYTLERNFRIDFPMMDE
jgi:hypothetical protein